MIETHVRDERRIGWGRATGEAEPASEAFTDRGPGERVDSKRS